MKRKLYVITLIAFLGIDSLWLGLVAPSFYRSQIGHLMAENANFPAAPKAGTTSWRTLLYWFKKECENLMDEEFMGCVHCDVLLPRHNDGSTVGQGGRQSFNATFQDNCAVAALQEQRWDMQAFEPLRIKYITFVCPHLPRQSVDQYQPLRSGR
jgi:hypothetical protein